MCRVSVVGNSGSGKSALASRVAKRLEAPYVELDALFHLPNWEQRDPDEFLREVEALTRGDSWVVDGNYRAVVCEGPVWERADTIVWLRLPRWQVMAQIIWRTLRRVLGRQVLWNGNRERLSNLASLRPGRSVIAWAWTQHRKYEERYSAASKDPRFVILNSHAEADAWLLTVWPSSGDEHAASPSAQ